MIKKIRRLYRAGTLASPSRARSGIGCPLAAAESVQSASYITLGPMPFSIVPPWRPLRRWCRGFYSCSRSIRSVADFGCGTGAYVAEFAKRGVAAEGFEYSNLCTKNGAQAVQSRVADALRSLGRLPTWAERLISLLSASRWRNIWRRSWATVSSRFVASMRHSSFLLPLIRGNLARNT